MFDLSYWYFFLLALFGAIVANATGAGGGVVFVPAFTLLGISQQSIIATSFAIQCFGMTAGTVAWHKYATLQLDDSAQGVYSVWCEYWPCVFLFGLPATVGVLLGQYGFALNSTGEIKAVFKWFSFAFGISILATTWLIIKNSSRHLAPLQVSNLLRVVFCLIGFGGGILTAWLSIGVGELVAVTLILMRFPVRMAIGVAVSVSAISVWVGVQKFLWVEPNISLNVLLFAAPAALIGGTVAKQVANLLSPVQLKIFIAAWILISAIAM